MNDPAASGQGIRQGLSFKSRGQRDAGPEWKQLYLRANAIAKQAFPVAPTASSGV